MRYILLVVAFVAWAFVFAIVFKLIMLPSIGHLPTDIELVVAGAIVLVSWVAAHFVRVA